MMVKFRYEYVLRNFLCQDLRRSRSTAYMLPLAPNVQLHEAVSNRLCRPRLRSRCTVTEAFVLFLV